MTRIPCPHPHLCGSKSHLSWSDSVQRCKAKGQSSRATSSSSIPTPELSLSNNDDVKLTDNSSCGISYKTAIWAYRFPDDASGLNEALRAGKTCKDYFGEEDDEFYDQVHEAMLEWSQLNPTKEDVTLYRGCQMKDMPQVGAVLEDKGWTSTSTSMEIAESFAVRRDENDPSWSNEDRTGFHTALMVIETPSNTPAVDTQHEDVKEIVLPPDTKMEVVEVKELSSYFLVKVAVLPQE